MWHYPLETNLKDDLFQIFEGKAYKLKIQELEKIRFNNILVVFWSNTGSVLSFSVTTLSFVLSIGWIYGKIIIDDQNDFSIQAIIFFVCILFFGLTALVLFISPVLLRKIIDHLPSETYANISLSNLNQSEVLTFVSLKYWELCNDFNLLIWLPTGLKMLNNSKGVFKEKLKFYNKSNNKIKIKEELKNDLLKLRNQANSFKTMKYKKISDCKALKIEATQILDILPIEFSHHITKFSPYMFEARLYTLLYSIESLQHLVMGGVEAQYFEDDFMDRLNLIQSIITELKDKRKSYLFQLIVYSNIHDYIIGLASVTSTSRSMNIFARGLSNLVSEPPKGIRSKYQFDSFKALLHRSKAHYGFDLLISLENFYLKNYPNNTLLNDIPKNLKAIKNNDDDKSKELSVHNIYNNDDNNCIKPLMDNIDNIRKHLLIKSRDSMDKIIKIFTPRFKSYLEDNKCSNVYIMIFGYSKMVRNVLRENHKLIIKYKVKIFVMKEEEEVMLDTRMLRYELNHKFGAQIRDSFTGSDDFFRNLLTKEDKLIVMAGAEAFDIKGRRLFHTNNYQKRVKHMIRTFQAKLENKQPSFWVIAEEYKIYKSFPNRNLKPSSNFINEFFVDHYDKVDVYNLKDMKMEVELFGEKHREPLK